MSESKFENYMNRFKQTKEAQDVLMEKLFTSTQSKFLPSPNPKSQTSRNFE